MYFSSIATCLLVFQNLKGTNSGSNSSEGCRGCRQEGKIDEDTQEERRRGKTKTAFKNRRVDEKMRREYGNSKCCRWVKKSGET